MALFHCTSLAAVFNFVEYDKYQLRNRWNLFLELCVGVSSLHPCVEVELVRGWVLHTNVSLCCTTSLLAGQEAQVLPVCVGVWFHFRSKISQRYSDGACNCLFPSFFMICHPYIPLHSRGMIFYTCSTCFLACIATSTGASPQKKQRYNM